MRERACRGERGQVLVLSSLLLIPVIVLAALVIDIGSLVNGKQDVRDALDSAALAASLELPVTGPAEGAAAAAIAREYAERNDDDLPAATVAVSFRCLLPDDNSDGVPDAGSIPRDCDPHVGGTQPFDCSGTRCVADCVPAQGDKCNVVAVSSGKAVPYGFARAIGENQGATGSLTSAACKGACGTATTAPLDLVVILDRTGSMTAADLANAKDAANSVLLYLDPSYQHVALGVLGPSTTSAGCPSPSVGAHGIASTDNSGSWLAAPWPLAAPSGDYQQADGSLNPASEVVQTIACLNTSGVGTNLGSPLSWARDYLVTYGRPGATKGIILMSDGEANEPDSQSCKYALDQAELAKAAGIELVTIGFGVEAASCADSPDPSPSPYAAAPVTELLADMASAIDGVPAADNGCDDAENVDGDNFFCEPRSADLSQVFVTAAAQISNGAPKLIALP